MKTIDYIAVGDTPASAISKGQHRGMTITIGRHTPMLWISDSRKGQTSSLTDAVLVNDEYAHRDKRT